MIFVRKQLSSVQGRHRRIGIIGSVALVQRLGASDSGATESESAIGERGSALTSRAEPGRWLSARVGDEEVGGIRYGVPSRAASGR